MLAIDTIRDHDLDDGDDVMLANDLSARTRAIAIIQELEKANEGDWTGYTIAVTG